MALSHPFTAGVVAKLFLDQVFKLHGLPLNIISDRDKIFTSLELFKLLRSKLHLSSAFHLQIDGLTERVNNCLKMYLRYVTFTTL